MHYYYKNKVVDMTAQQANDFMRGYFIAATLGLFATVFLASSLAIIPLAFLLLGAVWNYVDGFGGLVVARDVIHPTKLTSGENTPITRNYRFAQWNQVCSFLMISSSGYLNWLVIE